MKPQALRVILALCLFLLVRSSVLEAQTISFQVLTEFVYPSALTTNAYGLNEAGDVVGAMRPRGTEQCGFVRYADGGFSLPIIFPGSGGRDTIATAINNKGTIAGVYFDSLGVGHGFFLSGGVYTSYDHPNATAGTFISGINDAGDFVGTYRPSEGVFCAFSSIGGKLHEIPTLGGVFAEPADINNNGDIVGTAGSAGFRRESSGVLRYPLQRVSGVFDVFHGENENRACVGEENGSSLYYGGGSTYSIYDFPGLISNAFTGINRQGVICGYGFDTRDLVIRSYLVRRVVTE